MIVSVVKVALDWRFLASLTSRTVRDNCGFGNCSGRGLRRASGLTRSHDRMLSAATGDIKSDNKKAPNDKF